MMTWMKLFALLVLCSSAIGAQTEIAPRLSMGSRQKVGSLSGVSRAPAIAYSGDRYLLVYQDGFSGYNGNSDIRGVLVDRKGAVVKQIEICSAKECQDAPVVAATAKGFVVAWQDFRSGRDYDVYMVAVDRAGEKGEEICVAGGDAIPGSQQGPVLGGGGSNVIFLAWQDYRNGTVAIYGSRLQENGRPVTEGGKKLGCGAGSLLYHDGGFFAISGLDVWPMTVDGECGPKGQAWTGSPAGGFCGLSAYGRALEVLSLSPYPDPWGWTGNGSVIGLTLQKNGSSIETFKSDHGWGTSAAALADRVMPTVIDTAQWKNCSGWPQGRRGGFKGTHNGRWPNGRPAAVFNGRSILVAWPSATMLGNWTIGDRQIFLKRVVEDWKCVDEPELRLITDGKEHTNPALASDSDGGALLAWDGCEHDGAACVEFVYLEEAQDRQGPEVAYIQKMSSTNLIVGFNEPVDRKSVTSNCVVAGDAVVGRVRYVEDGPALGREILVETSPMEAGKLYPLSFRGITDKSGNAVPEKPYEYAGRPGTAQRTPFISIWLTIGRWPANYEADYIGVERCLPSEGDVVEGVSTNELVAGMAKLMPGDKYKELTRNRMEDAVPASFSGPKKWIIGRPRWANSVLDLIDAGHGKHDFALAYVHTYVWSDVERDVLLRIDSNNGHKAWLNGKIVSDDPVTPELKSRAIHDRTNEVGVKLAKGWNRLMLAVDSHLWTWNVCVQIVDNRHLPVKDLTWQLNCPPELKNDRH